MCYSAIIEYYKYSYSAVHRIRESSAATYCKSIHQFTRKETLLCRKKILKKLLKFGLLSLLLIIIGIIILRLIYIPQ